MKLAAGNPNLMKQATRVNATAPLGAFASTTGDKEQVKYRTGYKPSDKDPDAVPPATNSLWAQPVYKPDTTSYVRPGADDHLKIKSRGF
jgi:hypothetical protein